MREDISQLFDRLLISPFDSRWPTFENTEAGLDLDETDDHVIVRAPVPDLDPKHLQVEVRNGMLHVSYEHEAEWRPTNGDASGRQYAAFHRTVALPEGVDDERAEATCKHGVLTIRMPWRREAAQRSHRLTVSVE